MKKLRVLTVIQYDQDKFENEIADFFDENGIQPEDVVDIKYNVVNDNREIWFTAMIMYKIEVKVKDEKSEV